MNGTNPNAPEYLKAYKIANNAGCNCGGNGKKTCCIPAKPLIIIQANTRLSVNGCGFSKISSNSGTKLNVIGKSSSYPVC